MLGRALRLLIILILVLCGTASGAIAKAAASGLPVDLALHRCHTVKYTPCSWATSSQFASPSSTQAAAPVWCP